MTDNDLSTLLRDHVRRDEPALTVSAETAIALGRRTLRRRRARRGITGLALVGAAAAVAVPLVFTGGSVGHRGDRVGIDPMTVAALKHYDAQAMPGLLDQRVREVFIRSVPDLGPVTFEADDSQGQELPAKYYDKASSMEVDYGGNTDHLFRVALTHSRSEAEGDARGICKEMIESGHYFSCTVTIGPRGDAITTSVGAVRRLPDVDNSWGSVTRDELRTGVVTATDPSQDPIDRSQIYFMRVSKSVHSASFLSTASEIVRAPNFATAQRAWQVPITDLEALVTDPSLVIPEPPPGEGNCPWTLPGTGVSCSRS